MILKQRLLVHAFQQEFQHYHQTMRFYQVCVRHTKDIKTLRILFALNKNAARHCRLDAAALALLHAPISSVMNKNVSAGYVWERLLLCFDLRVVLAWFNWIEGIYGWLIAILAG